MKFEFEASFTFRADNIDDTFIKLIEHFKHMINNEESDLIELGYIKINLTKGEKRCLTNQQKNKNYA